MGTAQVQGELWGAKAADWADVQEPAWRPVYEAVMGQMGLASGTKLLDIGCGAGGALLVARELGAEVAGLDAAGSLVDIARKRISGARIEVGEMEELPFADGEFECVTGFNAFQFAGNVQHALEEAARVTKRSGRVAMLVWGPREKCDLIARILAPVFAMMPPPPQGAPPAPAFAEPGVIEAMMKDAGLKPAESGEFDRDFNYPDDAVALRAILSAGMLVRAIRLLGEDKVRDALAAALGPFTQSDGSVRITNRFRWVLSRRD